MDAAKRYEYLETLGEGSYGQVWLCRDRESQGLVAIKRFKDANTDSQAYWLAVREIKLLRNAKHSNVVSVLEAFKSQGSGNVYLVMEYAGNCLGQELRRSKGGLGLERSRSVTWQLASVLAHLHSIKMLHRDLKPANILLTEDGTVKLCDFGFARDVNSQPGDRGMSPYVTTRWYRAPEVIVGDQYGAAVDMWALGCVLAEVLTGRPLFPGSSNADQLALIFSFFGYFPPRMLARALVSPAFAGTQLIGRGSRDCAGAVRKHFSSLGPDAVEVLVACLHPDPAQRLTPAQLLLLPFFDKLRLKSTASSLFVPVVAPASPVPDPAQPPRSISSVGETHGSSQADGHPQGQSSGQQQQAECKASGRAVPAATQAGLPAVPVTQALGKTEGPVQLLLQQQPTCVATISTASANASAKDQIVATTNAAAAPAEKPEPHTDRWTSPPSNDLQVGRDAAQLDGRPDRPLHLAKQVLLQTQQQQQDNQLQQQHRIAKTQSEAAGSAFRGVLHSFNRRSSNGLVQLGLAGSAEPPKTPSHTQHSHPATVLEDGPEAYTADGNSVIGTVLGSSTGLKPYVSRRTSGNNNQLFMASRCSLTSPLSNREDSSAMVIGGPRTPTDSGHELATWQTQSMHSMSPSARVPRHVVMANSSHQGNSQPTQSRLSVLNSHQRHQGALASSAVSPHSQPASKQMCTDTATYNVASIATTRHVAGMLLVSDPGQQHRTAVLRSTGLPVSLPEVTPDGSEPESSTPAAAALSAPGGVIASGMLACIQQANSSCGSTASATLDSRVCHDQQRPQLVAGAASDHVSSGHTAGLVSTTTTAATRAKGFLASIHAFFKIESGHSKATSKAR